MMTIRKDIARKMIPVIIILVIAFFPLLYGEKIVESVKVEMETLPIFAVDTNGQPVVDLKTSDIELFVNNRKIKAFSFLRRTFLAVKKGKEITPQGKKKEQLIIEKKTVTLLFDTAASKATSVMRMKSIAEHIITNAEKNCRFIIMSIRPYKGLTYIAGPLIDRNKILNSIKKKVISSYNFRSPGEHLEFVYGKGGYRPLGGSVGKKGGHGVDSSEVLYAAVLRERAKNYIKYRSASLARAFEELYYSLNTIKGRKFLYLFTEGFSSSIGSNFYGMMAKYFLKTGAVTFIIDPAGGIGRDPKTGEYFLRSLAEFSGSKYLRGSTKNITRSIKNMHQSYYELAFEVPEDLSGGNIFVTVKPLRKNIRIYTTRFLEKSKSYEEMNEVEKKIMVLNLVTTEPEFNINLSFRDAKILKVTKNNGEIAYECFVPDRFLRKKADLFKVRIPDNRTEPIIEKHSVLPETPKIEVRFKEEKGFSDYFALINKEEKLVLVKRIPYPEIKIDNVFFENSYLNFEISGYLRKESDGKQIGLLKVTVIIPGKNDESVFSDTKFLQVKKDLMSVSIPLKQLGKGIYNVLIIANDLLTEREAKIIQPVKF